MMAEEERKWPVVLGVGALVAVPVILLLMLRPKPPLPEEPVGEQVSVEFVAL